MNSIFTDVERAFLCDYFGQERPKSLLDLDTYDSSNDGGISLRNESNYSGVNLANGVARLALSRLDVLGRGWDWGKSISRDWDVAASVALDKDLKSSRNIDLFPLYLFGVDWGGDTDFERFPEYYYLTWFPEFDRYVVTASVSNKNTYGVSDFAIGWDSASNKRIDLCHQIINTYWEDVHKPFNGDGWGKVLSTGLIPEQLALDWKDEIWLSNISHFRPIPQKPTPADDQHAF